MIKKAMEPIGRSDEHPARGGKRRQPSEITEDLEESVTPVGTSGWDSALEVRQLRAFLAVVDHGSVSAAAQSLGLAQSTVSEAMAALERALRAATVLRRRGAHHASLTTVGQALLPHARRVMQEIDAAHLAIASVTRTASGSVDIVGNESVITYLLSPALAALRKRWANTRFAVSVSTCAEGRARVAEARCDVGLLLDERLHPALQTSGQPQGTQPVERVLLSSSIPLVVFSGPGHPLVRATPRGAMARHTLAPYAVFVADAEGDFYELLRRYFAADKLPGPRLHPAGSIEGVKQGVADDRLALGVLPSYAVLDDLKRGRFVALAPQPQPPSLRLHAHLPRARATPHPAVIELLEQLRQA